MPALVHCDSLHCGGGGGCGEGEGGGGRGDGGDGGGGAGTSGGGAGSGGSDNGGGTTSSAYTVCARSPDAATERGGCRCRRTRAPISTRATISAEAATKLRMSRCPTAGVLLLSSRAGLSICPGSSPADSMGTSSDIRWKLLPPAAPCLFSLPGVPVARCGRLTAVCWSRLTPPTATRVSCVSSIMRIRKASKVSRRALGVHVHGHVPHRADRRRRHAGRHTDTQTHKTLS